MLSRQNEEMSQFRSFYLLEPLLKDKTGFDDITKTRIIQFYTHEYLEYSYTCISTNSTKLASIPCSYTALGSSYSA